MTTSGTVGLFSVSVTSVIEHAFRRCGKLASTISSELQLSARENLFFLLSDLANRGLSLWCTQKYVTGVVAYQPSITLPVGVVDVMNTLYRTKTDLTASAVLTGAGYYGQDLGSAQQVFTATIAFTTATTATLVLESSDDNVTWVQRGTFPINTTPALAPICTDADDVISARYWRARETSGTIPSVSSLVLSNDVKEVPMGVLSRDDYANLPNKSQSAPSGSKSLTYWFDKQITPRIWIWPVSEVSTDQVVVWTQRHIQDVGALTNTIDIPQRWYESIILTLACRCALELPAGELPPGRYELLSAEAERHLTQAENGESDGSPIRLVPNIRGYTS